MDALENYISGLRTESTRYGYRLALSRFSDFVGLRPNDMLEQRKSDLENSDILENHRFENLLRQFVSRLREQGKGGATQVKSVAAIRGFFGCYDLDLRMKRRDVPQVNPVSMVRPVTKGEIRKILAISDLDDRALILFAKDTGLACQEIASAKLENFGLNGTWREILNEENVPVPLKGVRRKTRSPYYTFLGPESAAALSLYFEQRESGTRHLDHRRRGLSSEKLTRSSHIFRCKNSLRSVDAKHISRRIIRIIDRAGLRGISAHSFRRFFETSLENPDLSINPAWIKRMMGHKLNRNERAYSHPTDEQLREAYRKAIPYLRVERRVGEERLRAMEEQLEQERSARERQDAIIDILIQRYEELKKLRT